MGMAAFLGFALAGCSDDVIDVNNQEQQVSKEPAYLSVTFSGSSTSSRSTADDANNQGDKDGNQEHSGHINLGTTGENNVNNALVVIKSTQDGVGGYARLYGSTEKNNSDPGVEVGQGKIDENGDLIDKTVAGETIYQAGEPIELTANTFEVLVVVNPYESLYAEYAQSLGAGTRNDAVIAALFNAITTGKYAVEETTLKNFTGEIVTISNNEVTGIMMANKELPQIKLVPGLTQEVEIPVERVASKITFRITEEDNVYPIVVPDPSKPIVITCETYKDDEGEHKLNKATYEGIEGPVYFEFTKNATTGENEFTAAWEETTTEGATSKTFAKITDFKDYDASKAYFDYTYETMTWNVKLTEYALVNLSKSVYNVRHIIEGNENGKAASGAEDVPFEKLDGTNFLYTPNWETAIDKVSGINGVTFKKETGEFENITSTDTWFFNTLNNVYKESNKEWEGTTQFAELAKSYTALESDKVYPGGNAANQEQHNDPKNYESIGYTLAYCLENSTDVNHQTHGLSTGITFKAQIYDANMKAIKDMYRYKGYVFDGLTNIQAAFPNDTDIQGLNSSSKPEEFEKAGVTVYNQNTCYYYTTEIKHFDNNIYPGDVDADGKLKEPTLGNMEFAIMRNNIYSLAVTAIEKIGDPYVDPIPSTPDEIAKPKLTVEAKIMPWIVRYHDIEF